MLLESVTDPFDWVSAGMSIASPLDELICTRVAKLLFEVIVASSGSDNTLLLPVALRVIPYPEPLV